MSFEAEKAEIRGSKSLSGVYSVLNRAGIDTSKPLAESLKDARSAYQYPLCKLILVAQMRINQIENKDL